MTSVTSLALVAEPKPTKLEWLCREFSQTQIPLEELEEEWRKRFTYRSRDLGVAVGQLGELYVLMVMEKVAQRNRQVRIFSLDHVETRTKHKYTYHPRNKMSTNILVRKEGIPFPVDEIDLIVIVKGRPIIVETSLGRYRYGGQDVSCIAQELRPENIRRKKEDVTRLCKQIPSIAYVISKEYERILSIPESRLTQYCAAGNQVMFFPYERKEWRNHVSTMVEKFIMQ